jgi:hypothetical protein
VLISVHTECLEISHPPTPTKKFLDETLEETFRWRYIEGIIIFAVNTIKNDRIVAILCFPIIVLWNLWAQISLPYCYIAFTRGGIQNFPDWCCHLYSSCGSAKHRSQQAKLWIPGSTAKFCGDREETCEDVALNFGQNRHGCFAMTTPSSFWRNTKWLSSPTHRTPLLWHPVTCSYFQKWNRSW